MFANNLLPPPDPSRGPREGGGQAGQAARAGEKGEGGGGRGLSQKGQPGWVLMMMFMLSGQYLNRDKQQGC